MKKILFKLLAWALLSKLEKSKTKRKEKIEDRKLTIKGLTDIEHHHHL